jgi:hypothetical protein
MVLTRNRVGLTGTQKWSWIMVGQEPSGRFLVVDICRSSRTTHGVWNVNRCAGRHASAGHTACACIP